jgi:small-conductance mechanosensitive channel
VPEFLFQSVAGNPLWAWMAFSVTALSAFLVLWFVRRFLFKRLGEAPERPWGSVVRKTRLGFLFIFGLAAGSSWIRMPSEWEPAVTTIVVVALLIQGAMWVNAFLLAYLNRYRQQRLQIDPEGVTTVGILAFIGQLAVWSVALLLILDNLGVDITALIAGLGIGGIAIALAVQNILADLFASLSIILDKPFVVGDFIIVGDLMGSVERIGIKTTRVRSLSGEQLVFSNADLLQSRIRNFKRMYERRVVFGLGLTYQTSPDQIEAAVATLREVVSAQSNVRLDRAHFKQFGASSLDLEIVYFVTSADYNLYMDIQQSINLSIMKRFKDLGVEFAYPTQTLYLEKA